ncbi:DNA-processing protein DprA [Agromyces endophyticus]|uniref:DNA-processing protein DprA n=1 Tax=Agromyces sp. H17E-10 TaxID=2932244 RepID=UPI001FD0D696|nr:DNA-processing protein DprA [Agromyces sp. H17E-10]UOQ88885.1 DNA-processing protein DprA [Agromyces sp. H17E-10]
MNTTGIRALDATTFDAIRGSTRDGDERRAEAEARALLGFLSEPGDVVLGRAVAAVGARATVDLIVDGAGPSDLASALGRDGDATSIQQAVQAFKRWQPRLDDGEFARSLVQAARVGARLVVPGDAEWPWRLDDLGAAAPLGLWVRGRPGALAEAEAAISLVGARAATGYGQHVTAEASAGLVDRGFAIISGGAYGIDGTAHRAALASDGTTIAFLAGGIDRYYPSGHETLLSRIAETGAVYSEVACGTSPSKWRFLQRNRLIAATGDATVVLEAGLRSGSLNTASHATDLGRPLGAVPGPVTSPASAGCHRLFRERDATCVVDAAQMAELASRIGTSIDARAVAGTGTAGDAGPTRPAAEPGPDGVRVLDALSTRSARSVDDIARLSGMSPGHVMAVLPGLEAEGLARRDVGGLWTRRVVRR